MPTSRGLTNEGRVGAYIIEVGPSMYVTLHQFYGATNADGDPEALAITNTILEAVRRDIGLQNPGPVIISGDLDCTISKVIAIKDVLADGTLVKFGANAGAFGRTNNETTCQASLRAKRTIRDYALANKQAYCLIKDFPNRS